MAQVRPVIVRGNRLKLLFLPGDELLVRYLSSDRDLKLATDSPYHIFLNSAKWPSNLVNNSYLKHTANGTLVWTPEAPVSIDNNIVIGQAITYNKVLNISVVSGINITQTIIPSPPLDHSNLLGLSRDDHTQYLLADGSRALSGNMAVDALITIDGRDLSVDGSKLDGIEALADVTDVTNVAAAGAAMAGGVFHDGFSDFVADEHIAHSGVSITAGSGLTGGGTIEATRTLDLDILGLSVKTIDDGDSIPFYDILTGLNARVTKLNLEVSLDHNNLNNYVSNEHIDHTGVLISTGTGLAGGGDISATRTLSLSHLKIEDLTDPMADRILFWDSSAGGGAGGSEWLTVAGTAGSALSGTTLTINSGYVDRGDFNGYDFTHATMTFDGTERSLDLSSIIPAGAYAVSFKVVVKSTAGNQIFFKKNGNTYDTNSLLVTATSATAYTSLWGVIACDSSRIINYKSSAMTECYIAITGWFI